MKGRNCPNCGAALDSAVCKCSYCGTSYFDISAIDVDSSTPFYLKMRATIAGKPVIVSTLVRTSPCVSMTWSPDGDDVTINLELQECKRTVVEENFKVEIMEEAQ